MNAAERMDRLRTAVDVMRKNRAGKKYEAVCRLRPAGIPEGVQDLDIRHRNEYRKPMVENSVHFMMLPRYFRYEDERKPQKNLGETVQDKAETRVMHDLTARLVP